MSEPTITFRRAYKPAPGIVRAEKTAAGVLPAAAMQYCEAARTASAFGWYVYPPKDIHLMYDGRETFFHEDGQWFPLKPTNFEQSFLEEWAETAPDGLKQMCPPFMTGLFVPGAVQIWSGWFVKTAPDWSVLVRAPANYGARSSFSCFEGIVETNSYGPWPLFINISLLATNREIYIPAYQPLFQVQPVKRECYREALDQAQFLDGFGEGIEPFDWEGFSKTVRSTDDRTTHRPGSYATGQRKRS